MKILFEKLFGVREGEGFRVSLMFAYIFFVIASLMIVKPVRNSLFLTHLGISQLPFAFVLVAAASGLVVSIYSRLSRKIRLNYLISATLLIIILNLLIFWYLLHINITADWFLYLFYIWVAIFGVITTTQFWLLANYIFNAREAKRLFGLIGAGAISGGIFGGYVTSFLAPILETSNLLFLAIGFIISSYILMFIIWQKGGKYSFRERIQAQKRMKQSFVTDNPFKLFTRSRHLALTAALVGIGVIVASLIDFQFSAIASSKIPDQDRLTAFFGFWLSNLSILALIIQLFLTGRILKSLGTVQALFFLPAGIFLGAVGGLFNPALWSAVFIKVTEGSLKQSVNKAGMELLSMPIPPSVKNQAKSIVDVFIDNLAMGLGGLLLIALTAGLDLPIRYVNLFIIALICFWIFIILKMKREYVNSFRRAIEKRSIEIDELSLRTSDSSTVKSLLKVLDGDNDRQILYVLGLLEDTRIDILPPYLKKLIRHPSYEIRAQALRMLPLYEMEDFTVEAEELISDDSQEVRIEAISYICQRSDNPKDTLLEFLSNPSVEVNTSALICAARAIKEGKTFAKDLELKELIDNLVDKIDWAARFDKQGRLLKLNIARIIGIVKIPELNPTLRKLLHDESAEILRASVISAGETQSEEFIPILISHLGSSAVAIHARESLAEYGDLAIDSLMESFRDPEGSMKVKSRIPKVLALIGSKTAVKALYENLTQENLTLRYETIRGLNKLREHYPMLKLDSRPIEKSVLLEAKNYYRLNAVLFRFDRRANRLIPTQIESEGESRQARYLIIRALHESLARSMERIFRLLSLNHNSRDIYNAYLGITSEKPSLRADAVEFLDNILDSDLKKYILPIVETVLVRALLKHTESLWNFKLKSTEEGLQMLLNGNNRWLVVCTLYLIAEQENRRFATVVSELSADADSVIAETAHYTLRKLKLAG